MVEVDQIVVLSNLSFVVELQINMENANFLQLKKTNNQWFNEFNLLIPTYAVSYLFFWLFWEESLEISFWWLQLNTILQIIVILYCLHLLIFYDFVWLLEGKYIKDKPMVELMKYFLGIGHLTVRFQRRGCVPSLQVTLIFKFSNQLLPIFHQLLSSLFVNVVNLFHHTHQKEEADESLKECFSHFILFEIFTL